MKKILNCIIPATLLQALLICITIGCSRDPTTNNNPDKIHLPVWNGCTISNLSMPTNNATRPLTFVLKYPTGDNAALIERQFWYIGHAVRIICSMTTNNGEVTTVVADWSDITNYCNTLVSEKLKLLEAKVNSLTKSVSTLKTKSLEDRVEPAILDLNKYPEVREALK